MTLVPAYEPSEENMQNGLPNLNQEETDSPSFYGWHPFLREM
ncbi:hypothetical protein [Paenibacillus monticola]|nr:hypothetical protein [Paenibacillus monticola]